MGVTSVLAAPAVFFYHKGRKFRDIVIDDDDGEFAFNELRSS